MTTKLKTSDIDVILLNKSAAISALDKLAVQTSNNMKSLLEQIKRGSINV
ncbi:hypothetical protein IA831_06125 [Listeria marthii]|nr:hypothetical protein [Listeria marthii]MBF2393114.1 hypothetical protein [Listeria marthii]